MKVLKDNYNNNYVESKNYEKPYPRKHVCEECGSELEYDKSDIVIGAFGCAFLKCPLCGQNSSVYDEDVELTLTRNNIEFPTHFWHTSKETGAVDNCNNEEVKKCIYRAIDYFRNNKNEYHWFTACGNLRVDVSKFDGDENYEVMVTKDYYETYIPFEKTDY